MDRRTTLTSLGSVLAGFTAGCLAEAPSDLPAESGEGTRLSFESRSWKDPNDVQVIEPGLGYGSDLGSEYVTVITDRAGIDRFDFDYIESQPEIEGRLVAFIRETDLERACLLVIQMVLPSGSMNLELESVEREAEHALHAYTRTPHISGGTSEALRTTIVSRVFLEGPDAIDRVAVTHTNEKQEEDETTTFTTSVA